MKTREIGETAGAMFRGSWAVQCGGWWARLGFVSLLCSRSHLVLNFKQNPMPHFPHPPNQIYGRVCPCCSVSELSP